MMRLLTFCILFFATATISHAQSPQRTQTNLAFELKSTSSNNKTTFQESDISIIPLTDVQPFLAYAFVQPKTAVSELWIRFSTDGEVWDNWTAISQDTHGEEADENWVSELQYAAATTQFYQYRWRISAQHESPIAALHFYSPGNSEKKMISPSNRIESRSCPCPQPGFEAREDWCPFWHLPRRFNARTKYSDALDCPSFSWH